MFEQQINFVQSKILVSSQEKKDLNFLFLSWMVAYKFSFSPLSYFHQNMLTENNI